MKQAHASGGSFRGDNEIEIDVVDRRPTREDNRLGPVAPQFQGLDARVVQQSLRRHDSGHDRGNPHETGTSGSTVTTGCLRSNAKRCMTRASVLRFSLTVYDGCPS